MEPFRRLSYEFAESLTRAYSTSFSRSTSLFDPSIRRHIYAIYGLVRIADELVDTYPNLETDGDPLSLARTQLDELERETMRAVASPSSVSANPIVDAFAATATYAGIRESDIAAFFRSMRMDLDGYENTRSNYNRYIDGSAEAVGLMCLKVFTKLPGGASFSELEAGARHLGSAYQKVNFLRDVASDYVERDRFYFPGMSFGTFDEADKKEVIKDIEADFDAAKDSIRQLPTGARRAVLLSYRYYRALLDRLARQPVESLKSTRLSTSRLRKTWLLLTTTENTRI